MMRIFTPVEIQRLRPGLNPQTWVPEASMLTTRPPKPSCNDITLFVKYQILTLKSLYINECANQFSIQWHNLEVQFFLYISVMSKAAFYKKRPFSSPN